MSMSNANSSRARCSLISTKSDKISGGREIYDVLNRSAVGEREVIDEDSPLLQLPLLLQLFHPMLLIAQNR
jgi:hypothetical protein